MSWLFGLVLFVVFLFLLFKYPKQILALVGLLVVCVFILWYVFITLPDQKRTERSNKVTLSIAYNTTNCGLQYPLNVIITNRSDKTVKEVKWSLVVNKRGFSTNLAGYGDDYSCDKILKPGEAWSVCYRLPSTLNSQNYPLPQLEYKTSSKYVYFEE